MDELPTPPNPFLADEASAALSWPSPIDLFFWPGDWAIYLVARYLAPVADWLGLGADAYGTSLAGFVALAVWLVTVVASIVAWASIRDFDRALTRGIVAAVVEARRRIRLAIQLAIYRRRRTKRTEPTIIVEEDPRGLRPDSSSHLYE